MAKIETKAETAARDAAQREFENDVLRQENQTRYADRISPEIAAKQAEYAARKWATFVCTRYFSTTSRFVTFREAVAYAQQIKTLAENKGESRDFWFELSGPGGKFAQDDVAPLLT